MGVCEDKSVTFLKGLGYNVVRHPNAATQPLDLIGVQKDEPRYLGPLNLLITNPPSSLPKITRDIVSADINGKSSSTLKIGVGVTILGNIIGAMGGNLGVNVNYTNAKQLTFSYTGVLEDSAVPLEVGDYLKAAEVDAGNLVLQQYVLGNGRLYLITRTAKSKKFTVTYEVNTGVDAKVDVPTLQGIAGGSVNVASTAARTAAVAFEGSQNLVFAFQCFEVGVKDGVLTLTTQQAGGVVFLAAGGPSPTPPLLPGDGLLNVQF